MPKKGEKSVKTGGRKKGTPNKRAIPRAVETLIQAREIQRSPGFKAWTRMCRLAAELDLELSLAKAKVDGSRGPRGVASMADIEEMRMCQDRLMEALRILLPYEKPKLSTTKVQGDRRAPLFDLSGLSESELKFIRNIVLKSQQVSETEEDG
jgi:hypothetical protein